MILLNGASDESDPTLSRTTTYSAETPTSSRFHREIECSWVEVRLAFDGCPQVDFEHADSPESL